jgi:transcription elongation factor Elf1
LKIRNIFMTRHHGVQCEVCGQSISTGIADLGLPIQVGSVHCPYCPEERFYVAQDRIEFDTDNGLPATDPA